MRVRSATWADRDDIAALVERMGGHDGETADAGWCHALGAALLASEHRVLVAEREGDVVGVVHIAARSSLSHGEREAWLGTIAVHPAERGSGVGHLLVEGAERAASDLGCDSVVLESSDWRLDAHAFYRGLGFEEHPPARRFVRRLLPGRGDLVDRFLSLAARAATAVGGSLASGSAIDVGLGADGLATKAVDAAAERAAVAVLGPLDLPIVSEEAGAVGGRMPRDGEPWIALDPLDGTRNFTRGHPPWAVSIGLVLDGRPLAGMVVDLSCGRRWVGVPGEGAWVDGREALPRPGGFLVVPGLTGSAPAPALPVGFDRLRMAGSTTVELCRVADGSAGGFADLDRGVVRVHDLAAAMAVLLGAGCTVVSPDGDEPYLRPDPLEIHRIAAAASADDARSLLDSGATPTNTRGSHAEPSMR